MRLLSRPLVNAADWPKRFAFDADDDSGLTANAPLNTQLKFKTETFDSQLKCAWIAFIDRIYIVVLFRHIDDDDDDSSNMIFAEWRKKLSSDECVKSAWTREEQRMEKERWKKRICERFLFHRQVTQMISIFHAVSMKLLLFAFMNLVFFSLVISCDRSFAWFENATNAKSENEKNKIQICINQCTDQAKIVNIWTREWKPNQYHRIRIV